MKFELLILIVLLSLLAPWLRERIAFLYKSTLWTPAYEGDGILVGDSGTNVPFSSVNWTITQRPMFRDSYHTVHIFAVPERVARRHLYPYQSSFSTSETFQVRGSDIHSVGARAYVYLLPKMYLNHGQEARAKVNVQVQADFNTETLTVQTFRFENREHFSNFVDLEPGSMGLADGCSCMVGDSIEKKCAKEDKDCIEQLKADSNCQSLEFCSKNSVHTSETNSYNFISSDVTENDTVRYEIDLLMYFYNTDAFEKYHMCTIRGTDSCSFQTRGSFKMSRFWRRRHIIIAYTEPASTPSTPTTFLVVEAEKVFHHSIMLPLLCLLIAYLIIRHCLHHFPRERKTALLIKE